MLENLFRFRQNGTTLRRDTVAGLTTFMVLAYIIFVNPAILGFVGIPDLQPKGLSFAAALTSTCLVAGAMTLIMGLYTNRAYALAPGMGLNAVVAFSLVAAAGLTMEAAMGIIVMEGIVITVLVLTGLREAIFRGIPLQLKKAIAIGVGFFILFIGLVDGGMVVKGGGTLVTLGDFIGVPMAVTLFGLVVTIIMLARHWKASILLGIIFSTVFATILNHIYDEKTFLPGTTVVPDKAFAAPDFRLVGAFDFSSFATLGIAATVLWVFSIMLSDFFDTRGTLIGVGGEAGYLDEKDDLPNARKPLLVDSLAAAAGVGVGGRTGWVAVIVALLFFAAMPFSPIAAIVPANATAPALIIVGSS